MCVQQRARKKAKQLESPAASSRGGKAEKVLAVLLHFLCLLYFCFLYFLFFLPSITACAAASRAIGTR
jgi:hypothetical protein